MVFVSPTMEHGIIRFESSGNSYLSRPKLLLGLSYVPEVKCFEFYCRYASYQTTAFQHERICVHTRTNTQIITCPLNLADKQATPNAVIRISY